MARVNDKLPISAVLITKDAEMYRRDGRQGGQLLLAGRAVGDFLRCYLLRRGFSDGTAGLVVALAGAVNSSVGLALASDESRNYWETG